MASSSAGVKTFSQTMQVAVKSGAVSDTVGFRGGHAKLGLEAGLVHAFPGPLARPGGAPPNKSGGCERRGGVANRLRRLAECPMKTPAHALPVAEADIEGDGLDGQSALLQQVTRFLDSQILDGLGRRHAGFVLEH